MLAAAAATVVRFIDCSFTEIQTEPYPKPNRTQRKKYGKKVTREMKKKKRQRPKTQEHATVVE